METRKLLMAILLAALSSSFAYSQKQNDKEILLVSEAAKIDKFYTIDELNAMGKAELIKLYSDRFQSVILLLPYSALSTNPGTSLSDLGIPVTGENKSLLKEENQNSEEFYESVKKSVNNFIAYADKNNIVWSIILFEDIIKKVNLGKDF
jgi:hypothetical protein